MHVEADVFGWVERGLAGVDPDADPDRAAVESAHRLADGRDRGLGGGESVEERVALVVDLIPVEACARVAHDPPVLRERLPIPVDTELLEQPRRALDVGEHQRHRPRRLNHRSHERDCRASAPATQQQTELRSQQRHEHLGVNTETCKLYSTAARNVARGSS